MGSSQRSRDLSGTPFTCYQLASDRPGLVSGFLPDARAAELAATSA
jgi:hypothetical protein